MDSSIENFIKVKEAIEKMDPMIKNIIRDSAQNISLKWLEIKLKLEDIEENIEKYKFLKKMFENGFYNDSKLEAPMKLSDNEIIESSEEAEAISENQASSPLSHQVIVENQKHILTEMGNIETISDNM
jgi:hypothetical protein